jgi:hypothetical protein
MLARANLNYALLKGANLNGAILERANLSFADLEHTSLKGAFLNKAVLRETTLRSATLDGASLWKTVLYKAELRFARLCNAYLNKAILKDADLYAAILVDARFYGANLEGADLTCADCSGADFREANIVRTSFADATLSGASLSRVRMFGTATEGWDLTNVKCRSFFYGREDSCTRIPPKGYLAAGEFEDRFKSRPTIEFVFQQGMPALGPAILGLAIDEANSKQPATGLRLLSIDARGGLPKGIIEIAEKVSTDDALALVDACYQQKLNQMQKEIEELREDKESLLQIASTKTLLPALGNTVSFMSVADIAEAYEVDPEALRKRLDRLRKAHPFDADLFVEPQDRGTRQPKYLYNVRRVAPQVKELKRKQSSAERPAEKK